MCLAVMAGGRVEVHKAPTSLMSKVGRLVRRAPVAMQCAAKGCPEVHRKADGYCHNHRAEAAAALAEASVSGGDALTITAELGKAGAEAFAPYVRENARLRTLVLRKTTLGADGMRVLADALKMNTVLTALDVSENELKVDGAKAVAELVRWVVCVVCGGV